MVAVYFLMVLKPNQVVLEVGDGARIDSNPCPDSAFCEVGGHNKAKYGF
ncbi:hypothetical protein [Burkholderia guangdongensis]